MIRINLFDSSFNDDDESSNKLAESLGISKFEIGFNNGGFSFKTDPSVPDDADKLTAFLAQNEERLKNLAAASQPQPIQQPPVVAPQTVPAPAPAPNVSPYSAKFESVLVLYEERRKDEVEFRTLGQYVRTIRKLKEWAEKRHGLSPLLMYQVDKKLISQYINYLQANKYKNLTIKDNHLAVLNTFFKFASSIGEYEKNESPATGHTLKETKAEAAIKVIREPYTEDELGLIFNYDLLKGNGNPCFYWLPILALYTGARINELCQLTQLDISKIDDINVIHITDENGGKIKTKASKRTIPLHPKVIELGFLNYVEDVKKYGNLIFPNLIRDPYGSYYKEPSRRFAFYMDDIGITSPSKVFHSFRTTANNRLKQNGITVEERNDMIGHESEGTNEKHYSQKYDVKYLYEKVLPALDFNVDFSKFIYEKDMFQGFIVRRLRNIKEKEKQDKLKQKVKKR